MSVVLLDTTVVSLPHPKKRRSEVLARYAVHMEKQTPALSFQSVAELWNGVEARVWGDEARNGLDRFIKRFLVIPYDYALARTWARAMQSSRKEGRRLDTGDCWIAATAIHRRIPLLTHDRDLQFIKASADPSLNLGELVGMSPALRFTQAVTHHLTGVVVGAGFHEIVHELGGPTFRRSWSRATSPTSPTSATATVAAPLAKGSVMTSQAPSTAKVRGRSPLSGGISCSGRRMSSSWPSGFWSRQVPTTPSPTFRSSTLRPSFAGRDGRSGFRRSTDSSCRTPIEVPPCDLRGIERTILDKLSVDAGFSDLRR